MIEFTAPLLGAVSVLEWVINHGNENPSLMPTGQYHAMISESIIFFYIFKIGDLIIQLLLLYILYALNFSK